jgi:hypothetical protein
LRRAQQARSLNIGPLQSSHDINIAANAVQQANNSWEQLRELKAEHTTSQFCTAEDIVLFRSTVCWLWGRARHLAFLRLVLHGLHYIPCLVQLKHLQLNLRRCSFCQVAGSLSGLLNLQTLSLDQSWGSPFKILIPSERPSLALEGLSQLQSVMLCCVVPASLTLPPGAALHLGMCSLECVRQPVWQTVASALQSVDIISCDDVVGHPSQLPSIFAGQSGLKSIMMDLASFGKPTGPIVLYGAFLQVESLLIQTNWNDLCMRVPAGRLPWRLARFVSHNALDIAFANVGDFLDCCPAFSMWYQSLGGSLMSFRQSIADRGIQWGSQFDSEDSLHEINSLCTPDAIINVVLHPDDICQCGACSSCSDRGMHMYQKQA